MVKRTFTDTALGVAPVALFIVWVLMLYWVRGGGLWVRVTPTILFFVAIYGVSVVAQARADARLDEVELAAARFGARWGLVSGIALMTLLTLLPPFHSLLAEIFELFSRIENRSMTGESRLFLFAVTTTFAAQEIFRVLFAVAWRWSKR